MKTRVRATAKVCLRCDWEGEISGRACPECGAGLWTPSAAADPKSPSRFARARARMAARAERNQQIASGVVSAAPQVLAEQGRVLEAPDRRARGLGWISVTAIVVVAVVAVVVVRAGTPQKAPLASTAFVGGRILYVAPDPAIDALRIWVWNLETGLVEAGPRVENPVSLLDASDAGQGRVAVISSTPDGGQEAGVLRFLESIDVPVPVLAGRFVAWSAGGRLASAVSVSPGAGARGCDRVTVRTFEAVNTSVSETWSDSVCGEVLSVHRTLNDVLVSFDDLEFRGRPLRPWVLAVPPSRTSIALPGVRLLGVSRGRSLFLVDPRAGADGALSGLAFDANPALYVDGSTPLVVERFLDYTWAGDGAFVLGSVGDERGVYRVPGYGKLGPKIPELVFATAADDVAVTETMRDVPIILADGRLYGVGEDESTELVLPEDAPAPAGPILWLERVETSS
ncbi:MAG: hypothetical protein WD096_02520 [Actinomycetota bacterium]